MSDNSFSDAPYQFFEPQPSRPVIAFSRQLNRFLLHYSLGVHQKEISGRVEAVRDLCRSGANILFVPNHPTRTDPQFVAEVQRQLGCHSSFMAAYDVFLEDKLQGWMMQKNGCFSVDRDGNDRKSMKTAIDILKSGERGLTIFPEGNVFQLNDQVTPLLEGPAYIAAKAQQANLSRDTWIVPMSLKYTYLEDVSKRIWGSLSEIASHSEHSGRFDKDRPIHSVLSLGSHLVSKMAENTLGEKIELDWSHSHAVKEDLYQIIRNLTVKLETDLGLNSCDEVAVLDRIRRIRAKIHQHLTDQRKTGCHLKRSYKKLSDQAHFLMRLVNYRFSYLSENPTLDRFAETVARIREDYFSKSYFQMGPRKAMAEIGEPISMRGMLADSGRNIRPLLSKLTTQIENSIQAGVDHLNRQNTEVGGHLIV